jgi:hypothetical protein
MHERMAKLGLSQTAVSEAGGPSVARLRQIDAIAERGAEPIGFQPGTLRKLDKALKWEQGSARDVLAGGDPRPLPDATVIRGHDETGGAYAFVVPPALASAMAGMTEAERAEVEARMVAEAFRAARELSTPG